MYGKLSFRRSDWTCLVLNHLLCSAILRFSFTRIGLIHLYVDARHWKLWGEISSKFILEYIGFLYGHEHALPTGIVLCSREPLTSQNVYTFTHSPELIVWDLSDLQTKHQLNFKNELGCSPLCIIPELIDYFLDQYTQTNDFLFFVMTRDLPLL